MGRPARGRFGGVRRFAEFGRMRRASAGAPVRRHGAGRRGARMGALWTKGRLGPGLGPFAPFGQTRRSGPGLRRFAAFEQTRRPRRPVPPVRSVRTNPSAGPDARPFCAIRTNWSAGRLAPPSCGVRTNDGRAEGQRRGRSGRWTEHGRRPRVGPGRCSTGIPERSAPRSASAGGCAGRTVEGRGGAWRSFLASKHMSITGIYSATKKGLCRRKLRSELFCGVSEWRAASNQAHP